MTLRTIVVVLCLTCLTYSHASPYQEPPDTDPPEECEYDEESVKVAVDEAVGEAIEAFRKKLKDCMNKASTLEAIKACGDIDE